jgi:preprotein translocase subunit SecE
MNTKIDASTSDKLDLVKWVGVVLLVVSGMVIYYFTEHSLWQVGRVLVLMAFWGSAAFVAATTEKGRQFVIFFKEAHIEVRKVVWPTRQETMQMTGIVILMVVAVALIIWLLDSILFWIVRLLTGQGG